MATMTQTNSQTDLNKMRTQYMAGTNESHDPNEAYRLTQSRILSLQETILDSSKDVKMKNNKGTKVIQVEVDSSKVFDSMKEKYGNSVYRSVVKVINYNPWGCSVEDKYNPHDPDDIKLNNILQVFPPFLPLFNINFINKLVTVQISNEEIITYLNSTKQDHLNKRYRNNEIWGTDIYTDDSDLLLVLSHLGVFIEDNDNNVIQKRTPVNEQNNDNVIGKWDKQTPCDLIVNILLLDTLQQYQGSKRFGLRSRDWISTQLHDGLSYGVYSIEFKQRDNVVSVSTWN